MRELEKIGVAPRATYAVDWSKGTGEAKGPYDRILIDAPCSGTGTIRRRPELALRRANNDVARLAVTQREILARAATLVKPGGRVVYAVCSILREEAEEVIAGASSFGLTPAPFDASAAIAASSAEATALRLLPSRHGTDGYFVASFVRSET